MSGKSGAEESCSTEFWCGVLIVFWMLAFALICHR
jgi:hypothetical protein